MISALHLLWIVPLSATVGLILAALCAAGKDDVGDRGKPQKPIIKTNLYDQEEIHKNCTVQILTNSVTGDVSVGWWEEDQNE